MTQGRAASRVARRSVLAVATTLVAARRRRPPPRRRRGEAAETLRASLFDAQAELIVGSPARAADEVR